MKFLFSIIFKTSKTHPLLTTYLGTQVVGAYIFLYLMMQLHNLLKKYIWKKNIAFRKH